MRGARADYASWAAGGAAGWGYDDVLPYFRRSEDNERGPDRYHGAGGPLAVSDGRSLHPLAAAFVAAGVEAGYPANRDFNGADQDGVGFFQLTQRDGMRCSTSVAFLHPALGRPTSRCCPNALAHRVVFEGGRAVGRRGQPRGRAGDDPRSAGGRSFAPGAYETPKLLMLSGIGPAQVLRVVRAGGPRRPAGRPGTAGPPAGPGQLPDRCADPADALTHENIELLETEGRGPLTSNIAEAGGFFSTRAGLAGPDVQLHMAPVMSIRRTSASPTAPCAGARAVHAGAGQPRLRDPAVRRTRPPRPRIQHNYLATARGPRRHRRGPAHHARHRRAARPAGRSSPGRSTSPRLTPTPTCSPSPGVPG